VFYAIADPKFRKFCSKSVRKWRAEADYVDLFAEMVRTPENKTQISDRFGGGDAKTSRNRLNKSSDRNEAA